MARVPFTGADTPLPAGSISVPDDYQRINADPSAFGAGIGQAEQALGGSLEKAGTTALDYAIQAQHQHDHAAAVDAVTKTQAADNDTLYGVSGDPNLPGFYSTREETTLNRFQEARKRIEDTRINTRAGLEGPRQQALYDQMTRRMTADTIAGMGRFRLTQQQAWQDQTSAASVKSSQDRAALSWNDPNAFQTSLTASQNNVLADAQRKGWSPEVTQQALAQNRSSLYGVVADATVKVNPQRAWDFYTMHRGEMTGTDQIALEGRLRPQLLAWSARADADRQMGGATSGAPLVAPIMAEAVRQNVPVGLALTTAKIESNFGQAPDRPGADPKGPFQMTADTWRARGGTDANRDDKQAQVQFGITNLAHSRDVAQQALGQAPQDWQVYLTHQQGDGGGPALLRADPNTSAVAALTPAYRGNAAAARSAIVRNGGSADMTAGQFLAHWQGEYAKQAASVNTTANTSPAADVRQNVAGWLEATRTLRDPFGELNPVYQEQVASHIRARAGQIEYGQAQQEKANRDTLMDAAIGIPQGAAPPTSPDGTAVAVPPRPTSFDQLFQNPAAKAAWSTASPDTRRGIQALIEHNAQGRDPPMTPDAQTMF